MQSPNNGTPSALRILLSNRLEAVVNLVYLVRLDRDDPDKVLGWVELADDQLQQIAVILRDHFEH